MSPGIDALAGMARVAIKAPEVAMVVPKITEAASLVAAPKALAGGIEAGLSAPHATIGHLAELKTDIPLPSPGAVGAEGIVPPAASTDTHVEKSASVSGTIATPEVGAKTDVKTGSATEMVSDSEIADTAGKDPNERLVDAGADSKTGKVDDPNEKWTDAGAEKKTEGAGDDTVEGDGNKVMPTEKEQHETDIKDAESKGEAAFDALANGTPEDAEKAITHFQEAANKLNGIKDKLDGNHKASVQKAVSDLLSKGADGKETQEAQELRMRLQTMMQMEGRLMIYRQQLEQVRNQFNQTRDKLKTIDQWWNKAVYDKDPKKRMEKYTLYSQLIGLQEVGKNLVNTMHEAKAVYAKHVGILNSRLRVHGVLGTMADYIVAKGYQVDAYAHRNSDWLSEKVAGAVA